MKRISWKNKENKDRLLACETDEELQEAFPDRPIESLRRIQRKLRDKEEVTLVDFIQTGKTLSEITEKFGLTEEDARRALQEIPGTHELFETKDFSHRKIFVAIPKPQKEVVLLPRIWTFAVQPEGQPYLWIKFPELPYKKLKIVPIADLHYGAHEFKRDKFVEYIGWIKKNPEVFVFLDGDIFENCSGESNRGESIFEQEVRPQQQREDMIQLLSEISDRILWANSGNHENRSRKFDFDPLEYVTRMLNIPYFVEPVYVDVMWNGQLWTFFCQHGRTGSLTEGGKINAAARPLEYQEHVHFTIMAHVHDAKTIRPTRIIRDRINFRLIQKKQYVVICPAFLEYFGSYASRMALKPGAWGNITCELYANGDYHATA